MKREKLRQARIKKGLSQQVAAELIGVSRNAWSLWECGKEDPYPVNMKELCTFFGVDDPDELDLKPRPMSVSKNERAQSSTTQTIVTGIAETSFQNDEMQQEKVPTQETEDKSTQRFAAPGAIESSTSSTYVSSITPLYHSSSLEQEGRSISSSHAITQDVIEIVHELERSTSLKPSDILKRRAVIAHLLGIPPMLFASDGHITTNLTEAMKYQEETLTSLYEDMLIMGWDSFRRSKSPQIITKIDEHVQKLSTLTRYASVGDGMHYQSLLCRFSQLSIRIAQHQMNESRALRMAKQAIMIAIDLDDAELIASTFYSRGRVYMEYSNTATEAIRQKKYFDLAKADIDAALGHVERVRIPLAGNIYLLATEIYARIANNDLIFHTQCERWQDNVAVFVESEKIEDDGTFLKLDPTALHHEKAKTLLRFGKIEGAQRELDIAWKTLSPNLFTWHMNMYLTQAMLLLAKHEIEESAKSSHKAYILAKTIHSQKGEVEVQRLLERLQELDETNANVQELTLAIKR